MRLISASKRGEEEEYEKTMKGRRRGGDND
jgi:hypothetical protein